MRVSRFPLLLALLGLVLAGSARGADAPDPERTHTVTQEDYFTQSFVYAIAPSPDGRHVAYTEARWDEEADTRNRDLWVTDRRGTVRRLTFELPNDRLPQWSPDGTWIYFLTTRERGEGDTPPYNGKTQVWRISPEGGEPMAVTRSTDGVSHYAVCGDGRHLYYVTGREHIEKDDWEPLRREFKKLEYGHGILTTSELHRLDLQTWRGEKLVDEERVITALALSPDERRVAMVSKPDETLLTGEGWSTVDVYDIGSGELATLEDRQWREEAPSPFGWILSPAWSADGAALAFRVDFDGYPGEVFFAHFDAGAEAPAIRKMVRPDEVTVRGDMRWAPRGRRFCFTAADRARLRVYGMDDVRGDRAGKPVTLTPGDRVVDAFGFAADTGELFTLMSGLTHGGDLFHIDRPGSGAKFERITNLNPQVDTWRLPQISIFRWTGDDGVPVEGVLELPPDYREGDGPLPLVLSIHGGPTSSSWYRFQYWIYGRTYFAAQGWAMLTPNYRGSTGYGDTFLTDLIGRKNDIDVRDILTGVDALIERGIVDPERMAVMGWSNGGFLTNCIITRDPRFKAASSGAGVFDTVMQWSIEDTPGHVVNFSRGLPWESEETMRRTSPLFSADAIRTPTVIHVGEHDERVPQEHSRSLYRALRHYLDVPTELVIYPGEGHGLTKYSHRKAKLAWDAKWFNYHVLGKSDEDM